MKKIPYILLIGAYERDNFGDILFSKIYDKILPNYTIVKASLLCRNLLKIGGDLVVTAPEFLKLMKYPPQAIIHCGGETLICTKEHGILMDIDADVFSKNSNYILQNRKIISDLFNVGRNPMAYLYNHKDLNLNKKIPIGFGSVGGVNLPEYENDTKFLNIIKNKLIKSKAVMVRDSFTKKYLKKYLNIEATLYPDVVSLISLTHKKEISETKNSKSVKKILSYKPYILFQANSKFILKYKPEVIALELCKIALNFKKSIILQPAGLANLHGSLKHYQSITRFINKINPSIKVFLQKERNIWTQVSTLTNSDCNIGTSLHVRIVSSSFQIPCVSLDLIKVNLYAKTWEIDNRPFGVKINNLHKAVQKALTIEKKVLVSISDYITKKTIEGLKIFLTNMNLSSDFEFNSTHHNINNFYDIYAQNYIDEIERLNNLILNKQIPTINDQQSKTVNRLLIQNKLLNQKLTETINKFQNSKSWRITKIFRDFSSLIKKILHYEFY